jgi:membrane protein implicated in regulation of membrane protease activity
MAFSMSYLFLASFIGGLLLGVRLMFFGAERRKRPTADTLPLRRWEPAAVGFLIMFGVASYLLTRNDRFSPATGAIVASMLGIVFAAIVTKVAIATARLQPEHDPDDPRYVLQGRVGIVLVAIPAGGEGVIRYEDVGSTPTVRARDIGGGAIAAGQEVCIERVEDGVAHVELWALVEQRL